jgi:hypothetical protein
VRDGAGSPAPVERWGARVADASRLTFANITDRSGEAAWGEGAVSDGGPLGNRQAGLRPPEKRLFITLGCHDYSRRPFRSRGVPSPQGTLP